MQQLEPYHDFVGRFYDQIDEAVRLEAEDPIEYAITLRYLQRYIPDNVTVADVGVGGGQYSELLARRGCRLHLADVSQRLLDAAVARLHAVGLGSQIESQRRASASDLSHVPAASSDVVLLLGPLYHLLTTSERRLAVGEAARLLRRDGIIFAAAINLLTYLRNILQEDPEEFGRRRDFFLGQLFSDGNIPLQPGQPAAMHLTTVAELRADLGTAFEEITLVGAESFASKSIGRQAYLHASQASREALLDLVERTGTTAEGLGVTSHYLYIG
jgi:2-polyprenyl-3-methyl-5-hydroxy-6-metoxy-1,4-benzoquinol methylase